MLVVGARHFLLVQGTRLLGWCSGMVDPIRQVRHVGLQ
jgi:hypothetical protein